MASRNHFSRGDFPVRNHGLERDLALGPEHLDALGGAVGADLDRVVHPDELGGAYLAAGFVHDPAALDQVEVAAFLAHHLAGGHVDPGEADDGPRGHVPGVLEGLDVAVVDPGGGESGGGGDGAVRTGPALVHVPCRELAQ